MSDVPPTSSPVDVLLAMASLLSALELVELERAVVQHVRPRRRERSRDHLREQLSPVAALLAGDDSLTQDGYERLKPPGAPSVADLLSDYETWKRVKRAARTYQPLIEWRVAPGAAAASDYAGPGPSDPLTGDALTIPVPVTDHTCAAIPWAPPHQFIVSRERTTPERAYSAVREVALKVGRPLTGPMYAEHVAAANARARRNNHLTPGWPSLESVRHACGTFEQAWAGAAVSDEELRQARIDQLPVGLVSGRPDSVASPTAAAPVHTKQTAPATGTSPTAGDDPAPTSGKPGLPSLDEVATLSLAAAVDLAREHEASLGWLCGRDPVRTSDRMPPAAAILDVGALRAARQRARVKDAVLRRDAGLDAGEWRRILLGSTQPDMRELLRLADTVGVGVDNLLADPADTSKSAA